LSVAAGFLRAGISKSPTRGEDYALKGGTKGNTCYI